MKHRKLLKRGLPALLALAVVAGLLGSIRPTQAEAATSGEIQQQIDELEAQKEDLQSQMASLEGQMQDNVTEMKDAVAQKQRIDQQVALLYAQIQTINQQISAFSVMIADKQDELDAAEARYEDLNEKNIARIRAMEEDGNLSYWSVLFKASSFSDLLDRMNMIEEIAAADHRRLQDLNQAAEAVSKAKDALFSQKDALDQTKAGLDQAKADLDAKRAEATELLNDLVARGEEYKQMMEEADAAKNAVLDAIALKEAEHAEAVYQEWLATYVPPTTIPPETVPPSGDSNEGEETTPPTETPDRPQLGEDNWMTPLDNYWITSPFGERVHPIWGTVRYHNGIDLAWDEGTPIYASRSGIVTTAEWDDACGNHVVLAHGDGYSSIYMHMSGYAVSEGDYVKQGQVIGYIGSTGWSTGPHLHFGIMVNGGYVNPAEYIYLDWDRLYDDD